MDPMVSICCITYNHEKFIREALEGFLMQKTDFPFEILVHDDASTDATPAILRQYEEKYPDLFRIVYQTENQYSKGHKPSAFLLPMARGKYIALCEGDDYWTDPLKLQKQVDFLESHPDHAGCFHKSLRLYQETGNIEVWNPRTQVIKDSYSLEDLIPSNFFATASLMFLKKSILPLPEWFSETSVGDWPLVIYAVQHGNIGFINEVMSVYRIHGGGAWSGAEKERRQHMVLDTIDIVGKHLGPKYARQIKRKKASRTLDLANMSYEFGEIDDAKKCLKRSINLWFFGSKMITIDRIALLGKIYFPTAYKKFVKK